ncbi:cold-inducible protein YdjO-related protein [Cohnella sp. AR92]|uniref:cold-inducible protein YdjO-related protein n=1 Tax=Cohnella sp. AR92 TaxID=648716 RepID=UPI000F8CE9BC|nr:cold-inducible protein YdjO-related protein [Cohnella sp. AR92]RUS47171.1 hypothetical protein ELR57_12355 [Cohnella sp. AR92]
MSGNEEEQKQKLNIVKILKCRNNDCKAWVREEFAVPDQVCPMCKGPMLRTMKHLPALQKKYKSPTR